MRHLQQDVDALRNQTRQQVRARNAVTIELTLSFHMLALTSSGEILNPVPMPTNIIYSFNVASTKHPLILIMLTGCEDRGLGGRGEVA